MGQAKARRERRGSYDDRSNSEADALVKIAIGILTEWAQEFRCVLNADLRPRLHDVVLSALASGGREVAIKKLATSMRLITQDDQDFELILDYLTSESPSQELKARWISFTRLPVRSPRSQTVSRLEEAFYNKMGLTPIKRHEAPEEMRIEWDAICQEHGYLAEEMRYYRDTSGKYRMMTAPEIW